MHRVDIMYNETKNGVKKKTKNMLYCIILNSIVFIVYLTSCLSQGNHIKILSKDTGWIKSKKEKNTIKQQQTKRCRKLKINIKS